MNKPNGYEDTREYAPKQTLPAGGYICIIKDVEEQKNRNGGDMVRVAFDIAVGDYRHFFAQDWEKKKKFKADAKYPICGQKWVNVNSIDGGTNRMFKSFCECFKKSNECDIDWEAADFGKQFVGMYIGIVFRAEEDEYDGRKYWQTRPYFFLSTEDIKEENFNIPKEKKLEFEPADNGGVSETPASGFMALDDIPDSFQATDDDMPF